MIILKISVLTYREKNIPFERYLFKLFGRFCKLVYIKEE